MCALFALLFKRFKIHIAFCVNVFLTFPKKMMISFALVDIYIFYPKILNDEHSLLEITLHSSFFEHFRSVIVLQSHNLPSFLHPSPPPNTEQGIMDSSHAPRPFALHIFGKLPKRPRRGEQCGEGTHHHHPGEQRYLVDSLMLCW